MQALAETLDAPRQHFRQMQEIKNLVGIKAATLVAFDRLVNHGGDYPVTVDRPELEHPLHMAARMSDVGGLNEIFDEKSYELPEDIDETINGKPVVDLGAYIGISACYFASRYPDSPVLAIEPHARNYEFLKKNAEAYGDRIKPVQAAVTPRSGKVKVEPLEGIYENFMTNRFTLAEDGQKHAHIPSITPKAIVSNLDKWIGAGSRIGLLKVDIEGAEADLFGDPAIDPLLARTDVLVVETHEKYETGCEVKVAQAAAVRNGFTHAYLEANHHSTLYIATDLFDPAHIED